MKNEVVKVLSKIARVLFFLVVGQTVDNEVVENIRSLVRL